MLAAAPVLLLAASAAVSPPAFFCPVLASWLTPRNLYSLPLLDRALGRGGGDSGFRGVLSPGPGLDGSSASGGLRAGVTSFDRVGTWHGITAHAAVLRSIFMGVGTYVGPLLVDAPGLYSISVPSPISFSRFSIARRVSSFPVSGLAAGIVNWTAVSMGSPFLLLLSSGSSSVEACGEAIVSAGVSAGSVVSATVVGVAVVSAGPCAGGVGSTMAGGAGSTVFGLVCPAGALATGASSSRSHPSSESVSALVTILN